jgi:hypothetical protein
MEISFVCKRIFRHIRKEEKPFFKVSFSLKYTKRKGAIHLKTVQRNHKLSKRGKMKICSKLSLFLQKYFTNGIKEYLLRAKTAILTRE